MAKKSEVLRLLKQKRDDCRRVACEKSSPKLHAKADAYEIAVQEMERIDSLE